MSTCEGSGTPAWHAEPVDTATPAASSRKSSESPSHPGKEKCTLAGRRPAGSGSPESRASGTAASAPAMSRSRSADIRRASSSSSLVHRGCRRRERRGRRDVLRAGAHPALLSPAVDERLDGRRAVEHERADAGRAADLVGGDAEGDETGAGGGIRGPPKAAEVDRHLAVRGDRVDVQRARRRAR